MCVVVKSMVWPGAMSYFWQGQWGEIYMGDGMKHEDVTFYPVLPPPIQEDPVEIVVHVEVSITQNPFKMTQLTLFSLYSQTQCAQAPTCTRS